MLINSFTPLHWEKLQYQGNQKVISVALLLLLAKPLLFHARASTIKNQDMRAKYALLENC